MYFSNSFVAINNNFCTLNEHVSAPCFRKSFFVKEPAGKYELTVCGLGFYELHVNGKNVTKGILAPYISNPTHVVYYDCYDITEHLVAGENVIGIILGNGFQNPFGGFVWDFDKVCWRGAPRFALALECDGKLMFEADKSFLATESPITFDEYRLGEIYDARKELDGWDKPGFDASGWHEAQPISAPGGDKKTSGAPPIKLFEEYAPIAVTKSDEGYLYKFPINTAGLVRLKLTNACKGQRIEMRFGEIVRHGKLDMLNLDFTSRGYSPQKLTYIAKGAKEEVYTPKFAYLGYQYAYIKGLDEAQATPEALTMLVAHSDLKQIGGFSCSSDTVNKLFACGLNSDLSNFYYFPTDCPHREKNGWTGDASSSAEHMLLTLDCETSFKEWLYSIRKAMKPNGMLPGIVPTDTWGYKWGSGIAWDAVLITLPYYSYRYTGDREILSENSDAIYKYLQYMRSRRNSNGLLSYGLGDWLQPDRGSSGADVDTEVALSIVAYGLIKKSEFMFGVLGEDEKTEFARAFGESLRHDIRKQLIDYKTLTIKGDTQTGQALAIYSGIFNKNELDGAVASLVRRIKKDGDCLAVGLLGIRVLFHVLSNNGYADLAYKLITQDKHPSYAYGLKYGATSLWESFIELKDNTEEIERKEPSYTYVQRKVRESLLYPFVKFNLWIRKQSKKGNAKSYVVDSHNHHFMADINSWFIKSIAGINVNPDADDLSRVDIKPHFIEALDSACGYHKAACGKIEVKWERNDKNTVVLKLTIPDECNASLILTDNYCFADGTDRKSVKSGEYVVIRQ